jgi:two-component system, chemotaxis family, chemotaxis protein CheY
MRKILFVDDSFLMRHMLKDIAVEMNMEIETIEASDGIDAVKKFKKEKPDLVFMDIIMGDDMKSGIEALKGIIEFDRYAKVIMCTSIVGSEQIIEECISAGALEYISKPFKKNDIIKVIEMYIDE